MAGNLNRSSCRTMQLARRRGYGTFKVIDISVECYNSTGKYMGANRKTLQKIKQEAIAKFNVHFLEFRKNVEGEWDLRVSFDVKE